MSMLAAPARRALERAGVTTLVALAKHSEQALLQLHGIGPSSIPLLKRALGSSGLRLRKS